jgi:hypothetical protein
MANGTRAPVALASLIRPKGKVYIDDAEIDDADSEYIAERIANPRPGAKVKLPTMAELTKSAYAKFNNPPKKRDE